MILQDDATLCGGFLKALGLAIEARPDSVIALFVSPALRQGARRVIEACARDDGWAALDPTETWIPVVGLVWPARLARDFAVWGREKFPPEHKRADDALAGRFVRERGERVWATVPSLVEHPDDVESILDLRTRVPRRAVCFAGETASLIDWSKG